MSKLLIPSGSRFPSETSIVRLVQDFPPLPCLIIEGCIIDIPMIFRSWLIYPYDIAIKLIPLTTLKSSGSNLLKIKRNKAHLTGCFKTHPLPVILGIVWGFGLTTLATFRSQNEHKTSTSLVIT